MLSIEFHVEAFDAAMILTSLTCIRDAGGSGCVLFVASKGSPKVLLKFS